MTDIKLVACDMDGTLLNDDKEISKENIKAVKRLQDAGIYFVIATGRHDSMIKAYLDILGIEMPVISCNGAMVREPFHDKIFSSTPVEKEKILKIADICHDHEADYHIYCHNTIFGESMTGKMGYYNERNLLLPEREQIKLYMSKDYRNFIMTTSEELYKVLILSDNPDELKAVSDDVIKQTGLVPSQSDRNLIDTMQKGVSKARALNDLITKLGIKVEETAAIGDQLNDLDMINFAGTGIAMANAVPEIKKAASFTTGQTNHESGVAEAIGRLLE